MIKIETLNRIDNIEHVVVPTIFPDNTSQCWHLPEEIIESLNLKITWNFEAERELIDLLSLTKLLSSTANKHLHIPYLPYARQDKSVKNDSTFNLHILAELLNLCNFNLVTAVDVHNYLESIVLIKNLNIISMEKQINKLMNDYDCVLYPDDGAKIRYSNKIKGTQQFTCIKERDQTTGKILSHKCPNLNYPMVNSVLIVDDICDGGATFINVAKMLKEQKKDFKIGLFVTHGIFNKGKQVLHDAGIDNIYTTNSLLKNVDGFKV